MGPEHESVGLFVYLSVGRPGDGDGLSDQYNSQLSALSPPGSTQDPHDPTSSHTDNQTEV